MARFIEEGALEDEELETEELEDRGDELEEDDEIEDSDQDEDDGEGEDDEGDADEDEEPKKREPKIPKYRFDEVIQQREDAKERNLWLENQLEKLINASKQPEAKEVKQIEESSYDFDKAEEDYISLVIEGEIAKATKLRNEINKERKVEMMNIIKGIETNVSNSSKLESSAVIEQDRFDNYIDTVEAKYPFLNSKDKAYNEEAVDTVNTLLAGYISAGKTKTEGLKLAVSKVAPFYISETKEVKQSLGNKRTVDAGKKAVKAANSQPVKTKNSTSSKAVDNSDVNVEKISEKDFAKLTAKERSILRGD